MAAPAAVPHCPTGGDPQPPIYIARGVAPSSASTTPTELGVCLNQDVDRLLLLSQVLAVGPVTSCITREVLRIGRNPTTWDIGSVRAFSLSYPEVLPAGTYSELMTAVVATSGYDYFVSERSGRFFEVDAGGVRPISSEQYELDMQGTTTLEGTEPCPHPSAFGDIPNDEAPADETISVVDLDGWAKVATIQPLRHEVSERSKSSGLRFAAHSARGERIELQFEYWPEAGVAFEANQFSLRLQQPDLVDWYSRSGRVIVRDLGDARFEVRLVDVVLERGRTNDEPIVTRALPEGSITGPMARSCRARISDSVDPAWSSPFCSEIRRAAGF